MMVTASALHHDILFKIFYMIVTANDDVPGLGMLSDTDCLEHLRHASQTCSAWRQTLLSSPSIWAICLDMDYLQSRTESWRMEIIGRTANAPIRVTRFWGSYCFSEQDEWFFAFLKDNWHRLCSLNIVVHPDCLRAFLEIQNLPAPNLVFCQCTFLSLSESLGRSAYPRDTRGTTLFGGGAPHLRSLLINLRSYRFDALKLRMPIQGPHFSQLRTLDLSPVYHERNILQALSSTPLIESLALHFSSGGLKRRDTDATTPLGAPKILSLPSLKKLKLEVDNNIPASIRFLKLLDMDRCNFTLDLFFFSDAIHDFTDVSPSLLGMLSAYFLQYEGERLTVQREPLSAYLAPFTVGMKGGPRDFSIVLQAYSWSLIPDIDFLFRAFADSYWYETAEELLLTICATRLPELRILLSSLPSVKSLKISAAEFALVHKWGQLGSCVELLPALEEVEVHDVAYVDELEETVVMLREFSDSRISCGGKLIQAYTSASIPDHSAGYN